MNLYFLIPCVYQKNVFEIDYQALKDMGIKCLLFDLDNTIVPYNEKHPDCRTMNLMSDLSREFHTIIMSNNGAARVKSIGEEFGIESMPNSQKPLSANYNKVLGKYGYQPYEVAFIGDQLFTDILGANRVGLVSILVDPLEQFKPLIAKILSFFEEFAYKRMADTNIFQKKRYYQSIQTRDGKRLKFEKPQD